MNATETRDMTAEEFNALCQSVGLVEALRTYQRMGLGSGDYTRDRHQWLDQVTQEEIEQEWSAATNDDPASTNAR